MHYRFRTIEISFFVQLIYVASLKLTKGLRPYVCCDVKHFHSVCKKRQDSCWLIVRSDVEFHSHITLHFFWCFLWLRVKGYDKHKLESFFSARG